METIQKQEVNTIPGLQEPAMTDAELAEFRARSKAERDATAQQNLGHNALLGLSDGTIGTAAEVKRAIDEGQERSGAYDGHGRE